ncbi:hypothetical protein Bca52824_069049 [Brassica carinata]|uniref:Translocon at inner membrane of chloroplasts 21 n=1 Tax=Brassica carinata TaxID=52824 RepID=A0A8X7Q3S7_BRACI|nr:hypothetical protein Bca52824_069049 [Brassica carinata]
MPRVNIIDVLSLISLSRVREIPGSHSGQSRLQTRTFCRRGDPHSPHTNRRRLGFSIIFKSNYLYRISQRFPLRRHLLQFQVAKRLEKTSRYFKRLGSIGFWGQLVSTLVAAVILSFSIVVTGKPTSPAFYATASGIAAAFVSVFWSFGYIRLSETLRRTAADPAKAPPRADVVKGLRSGIMINLLGMGAAILGMQATVGFLVAKALTTSANPFYQGVSQGYSPVLALDVFLVQASANTLLSHFLGLVCSLELLRSVTVPNSESIVVPKVA